MKRLLQLLGILFTIYLVSLGEPGSASSGSTVAGHTKHADQTELRYNSPTNTALFFLNQENSAQQILSNHSRLQPVNLLPGNIAARNCYCSPRIRLNFYIHDHEAPVPVFIRGHALLC